MNSIELIKVKQISTEKQWQVSLIGTKIIPSGNMIQSHMAKYSDKRSAKTQNHINIRQNNGQD